MTRRASAPGRVTRDTCRCGAPVLWDVDVTQRYEQIADVRRPHITEVVAALHAGRVVYRYTSGLDSGAGWLNPVTGYAVAHDLAHRMPAVYRLAHECTHLPRGHREEHR